MKFRLFDHTDVDGVNQIKIWSKKLEKPHRAKLNAKLDMLMKLGVGIMPEVLTGTNTPGILKLRVKGKLQLRPMLCKGPLNVHKEFTLLLGAIEKGGVLIPAKADAKADKIKAIISKNHNCRVSHERIC